MVFGVFLSVWFWWCVFVFFFFPFPSLITFSVPSFSADLA